MRICHCTLHLTNPEACQNCNLYNESPIGEVDNTKRYWYTPFWVESAPIVKKTVVKEYDKDGNLIKETITENNS